MIAHILPSAALMGVTIIAWSHPTIPRFLTQQYLWWTTMLLLFLHLLLLIIPCRIHTHQCSPFTVLQQPAPLYLPYHLTSALPHPPPLVGPSVSLTLIVLTLHSVASMDVTTSVWNRTTHLLCLYPTRGLSATTATPKLQHLHLQLTIHLLQLTIHHHHHLH